jgi:hypothetical protein
MKLNELKGCKSFRDRNSANLAALAAWSVAVAKPHQRSPREDCRMDSPAPGLGYRITLTQFRRKLMDGHDNLAYSAKPLVDQITTWLGYTNDADHGLHWEYGQQQTLGEEGMIVKIQSL